MTVYSRQQLKLHTFVFFGNLMLLLVQLYLQVNTIKEIPRNSICMCKCLYIKFVIFIYISSSGSSLIKQILYQAVHSCGYYDSFPLPLIWVLSPLFIVYCFCNFCQPQRVDVSVLDMEQVDFVEADRVFSRIWNAQ